MTYFNKIFDTAFTTLQLQEFKTYHAVKSKAIREMLVVCLSSATFLSRLSKVNSNSLFFWWGASLNKKVAVQTALCSRFMPTDPFFPFANETSYLFIYSGEMNFTEILIAPRPPSNSRPGRRFRFRRE